MKKAKYEKMRSALEELGCDAAIFPQYNLLEIGRIVFAVSDESRNVLGEMGKNPYAAGMEVGRLFEKFEISLPAATFACVHSSRRTAVNDLGEKLFTYGRDVFLENIVSRCPGLCFVVNERNECLGIGFLDTKMLENRLDIGSYLRGFGDER
jgi:ribosome biogenesis protein Nip4